MTSTANVGVLTFANKTLDEAKKTVSRGLTYPAGILDWNKAILVTISDASFASETRCENGRTMPRRSQKGRVTILADPSIWDQNKAPMYVLGWRSTMIRRVCRSTFAAETQAMGSAVKSSERPLLI